MFENIKSWFYNSWPRITTTWQGGHGDLRNVDQTDEWDRVGIRRGLFSDL